MRRHNIVNQQGILVKENIDEWKTLLFHRHGNYVLSAVIKKSTPIQRLNIISSISTNFNAACFNEFGKHPIQELLECNLTMPEAGCIKQLLEHNFCDICLVTIHNIEF